MLTEWPVALRRSMVPNCSPGNAPKLRTPPRLRKSVAADSSSNSLKYWGLRPLNLVWVLIGLSWDKAASRVKTLNVDPACMVAIVEVLNWFFW